MNPPAAPITAEPAVFEQRRCSYCGAFSNHSRPARHANAGWTLTPAGDRCPVCNFTADLPPLPHRRQPMTAAAPSTAPPRSAHLRDPDHPAHGRLILQYTEQDDTTHSAEDGWIVLDRPWVHFYADHGEAGWQTWTPASVLCIDWDRTP